MVALFPARPRSSTSLPTVTTSHCASAGNAMSKPIVPTMRAYTGAFAKRRNKIRSSARPSSGANRNTQMITDGTIGTPSPVFSW